MASKAIETRWIKSLQSAKMRNTKITAARTLGQIATPRAIDALLDAIGDPRLNQQIISSLSSIQSEDCTHKIFSYFHREHERTKGSPLSPSDVDRLYPLLALVLQKSNAALAPGEELRLPQAQLDWLKERLEEPLFLKVISPLFFIYKPAGVIELLLPLLSSQEPDKRSVGIDAAFTLSAEEAYALLRPYLSLGEVASLIFSRLIKRRAHTKDAHFREHYQHPGWLRYAAQQGLQPHDTTFDAFLRMLFSLLPQSAYDVLTGLFTVEFVADPKNRPLAQALFLNVFHRDDGAILSREHRWITLYLAFALEHQDPEMEQNLARISQLELSAISLMGLLPPSLFVSPPPRNAGLLLSFLSRHAWLCSSPSWEGLLQKLRPQYPSEVEAILVQRAPLSSVTNNAESSPQVLEELAKSQEREARLAVVKNPNTPLAALFSLAKEFPEEFCGNPSLELLLLEDSTFFEKFAARRSDQAPLKSILSHPAVPQWLLSVVLLGESFRLEWRVLAIRHPKAPQEVIDQIASDDSTHSDVRVHAIRRATSIEAGLFLRLLTCSEALIRSAAAKRADAPRDFIKRFERLAKVDVRLSAEELEAMSAYGIEAKLRVVRHPDCPPALLLRLAQLKDVVSPENMRFPHFAQSFQILLRFEIARHPNCPLSLLEDWARAPSPSDPNNLQISTHAGILQNKNVTPEMLVLMTNHTYPWGSPMHSLVALHPKTPVDCLRLLAKKEALVRSSLAKNPNTPSDLLEVFLKDQDKSVRVSLLEQPSLPKESLLVLSRDPSLEVRVAVASHPNTPPDALLELSKSGEFRIRNMLAQNPNTPREALRQMLDTKNAVLRKSLRLHPNFGAE